MAKIYIYDRLYIPKSLVSEHDLDEYRIHVYDEYGCNRCSLKHRRYVEKVCGKCVSHKEEIRLWKTFKKNGKTWYAFPNSQWSKTLDDLGIDESIEVIDKRPKHRMTPGWKFTGELFSGREDRADQVAIVKEFIANTKDTDGSGIMALAVRNGKNACSIYCMIKLGYKTLMTASELSWLEQWCDDLIKFTNVDEFKGKVWMVSNKPSSQKLKPWINVVSSWEKVPDNADIVVSTYQSLIFNDKRFDRVRFAFSHVITDESHLAAADAFSRILNNLAVRRRTALTGTPDRNDNMSPIIYKVMGPVAVVSDKAINPPALTFLHTNFDTNIAAADDVKLVSSIIRNKARLRYILDCIFYDLARNKDNCLLLPVSRVAYAQTLTRAINERASHENERAGKKLYPIPLAVMYTGQTKNLAKVREDASNKVFRVTIANVKMARHGLSIPAWNIVYTGLTPMTDSNHFYQLINRVSTPTTNVEGEVETKKPLVRHVFDKFEASRTKFLRMYNAKYKSIREQIETGKLRPTKETMKFIDSLTNEKETDHGGLTKAFGRTGGWIKD